MSSLKILVVDDEIDLLNPFKKILELKGHIVQISQGGHEAFRLYQKNTFDAILTDMNMPQGSGAELLKSIKCVDSKITVVCFVSTSEVMSFRNLYKAGADSIQSKPVDIDQILEELERLCLSPERRWLRKPSYADGTLLLTLSKPEWGRGGFSAKVVNVKGLVEGGFYKFHFDHVIDEELSGGGWLRWVDKKTNTLGFEICYIDKGYEAWLKFYRKLDLIALIP